MSDNRKPDIYVLWTGGWDSTFRMVQMSRILLRIHMFFSMTGLQMYIKLREVAMKKLTRKLLRIWEWLNFLEKCRLMGT